MGLMTIVSCILTICMWYIYYKAAGQIIFPLPVLYVCVVLLCILLVLNAIAIKLTWQIRSLTKEIDAWKVESK